MIANVKPLVSKAERQPLLRVPTTIVFLQRLQQQLYRLGLPERRLRTAQAPQHNALLEIALHQDRAGQPNYADHMRALEYMPFQQRLFWTLPS